MLYRKLVPDLINYLDTSFIILEHGKGHSDDIRVVWSNEQFVAATGFTSSHLTGQNALRFLNPDTKDVSQQRVIDKLVRFEYCRARIRVTTLSGSEFVAWLKAFPVTDKSPDVDFLIIVIENPAEEIAPKPDLESAASLNAAVIENERFLRSAVGAAGVGLWEWHVPSNQVHYSPEWFTMLGYRPYEYPPGFDTWELLTHPVDAADILEKADNAFAEQLDEYEGRFRMKCKDGSWKWVKAIGHVTERDESGNAVRVLGTHIDISDEVERERLLTLALERAQEAKQSKERFLAVMSHEIRTPLNGVLGMLDFVLNTKLADDQRDYLEVANISAKNLLSILNDTLDYSKLESGAMELEISNFDLAELVHGLAKLFTAHAMEHGIELHTDIDDSFPKAISGDPTKIRQVLLNLVGNAVKFTAEGSVNIRLRANAVEAGKVSASIEVEDTGIGIPVEARETIFESFTQADASTSRRYGGTGLGLAITQKIVALIGGDISFDSSEGVGTIFTVSWDADLAQNVDAEEEPDSLPEQLIFDAPNGVLLVEGHPINRRVISQYLNSVGVSSTLANNGLEALDFVEQHEYDLILMDIQMPIMDGVETTLAIRGSDTPNHKKPIIALIANAIIDDKVNFLKAGMDDYVTKPIDPVDFKKTLGKYLPTAEPQLPYKVIGGGDKSERKDRKTIRAGISDDTNAALDDLLDVI